MPRALCFQGGGVYVTRGTVTFSSCTITGNTANIGPNVYVYDGTICSWATTLTGVFGSVSTCPAPPPSPPSPPPTTDDQMGVIIGVTVGVVLALAIALVILHRYCREKVNLTAWKPWNPPLPRVPSLLAG